MLQFKKEESRLIYEHILQTAPKDMVMLDVGARKGKWLVPYLNAFPKATFHCFEALPEHYIHLENRFRKKDNVFCYNYAISDNHNQVNFYKDLDRAGWSGLRKHSRMENFQEIKLETRTLDSFNLTPNFIKMDIEGAELLALYGCINTLKNTDTIYFECQEIHFKEYNYTAIDLYKFLIKNNFVIKDLKLNPISLDEFAYTTKQERLLDPNGYQSNFIASKY